MILTTEQINELVDKLKPLGCTTYYSPFVGNVSIFVQV